MEEREVSLRYVVHLIDRLFVVTEDLGLYFEFLLFCIIFILDMSKTPVNGRDSFFSLPVSRYPPMKHRFQQIVKAKFKEQLWARDIGTKDASTWDPAKPLRISGKGKRR